MCFIIKSVDSISRDGPDTPIYIIHYKEPKSSVYIIFSHMDFTGTFDCAPYIINITAFTNPDTYFI